MASSAAKAIINSGIGSEKNNQASAKNGVSGINGGGVSAAAKNIGESVAASGMKAACAWRNGGNQNKQRRNHGAAINGGVANEMAKMA